MNEAFIQKADIESFKSLKNSSIQLKEGLNIIIGKNGSGKSNMLEFLYRYAVSPAFGRSRRSTVPNYTVSLSKLKNNLEKQYEYTYSMTRLSRSDQAFKVKEESLPAVELSVSSKIDGKAELKKHKILIGDKKFRTRESMEIIRDLRIPNRKIDFAIPETIRWLSKTTSFTIDTEKLVDFSYDDDEGQMTFFQQMELHIEFYFDDKLSSKKMKSGEYMKKAFSDFVDQYFEQTELLNFLSTYTPINQIRINPNINVYFTEENILLDNIIIDFLIDGDWIPWSFLSDGTRRLFYLISECITIQKGVLFVEEPELGIHPHQLLKVLNFLKEQSSTKQVIITTHSPISLDVLNSDELDRIIVCEYNRGSKFGRLNAAQKKKAISYMKEIGELSYYWLHSDLEK